MENNFKRCGKTKFIINTIIIITLLLSNFIPTINATEKSGTIQINDITLEYRNVTVYAPAVGESQNGYIGVISTITVTIQDHGSGRVFVDTLPLAQIDMQGSARLAVNVASAYVESDNNCTINPSSYDYFFVIRTGSPIIGGPSAGAIMTSAVIALLENWDMNEKTVMTGMINPDGSIGPIGGITKKIDAANSVGATRFLIPKGQGTYIQHVTETVNTQWGTQIVTHEETRNISDYAAEKYGIEVIEVEDINDVLLYYTGHQIPLTATDMTNATYEYLTPMKQLATTLLKQAEDSLQNASSAYESTDIPNNYLDSYDKQLADALNSAEDEFEESDDWYNQQKFYTSTSKSFQSLINTRFINYACAYFNASNKESYMESLLDQSLTYYENQSSQAKQAKVQGAVSLQCIGAAQKRATDASSYISYASSLIQKNDDFSAIYQLAFAVQRAESISWWLSLIDHFNDTSYYSDEEIQNFADDYIQDAQQAIIYAEVILQEVGSSSSLLIEASTMLDNAKDDKNDGYPAAALFEALEALAKANLALELVDATTQDKIESKLERANQSAIAGISESRALGIEPILAVSYYEFAESLIEDNVRNSLFYYKFSDLLTGVLTVSGNSNTDIGSRYVGIPERNINIWQFTYSEYQKYFVLYAIIGIVIGILLGILIGLVIMKKGKQTDKGNQQPQWTPSRVTNYQHSMNNKQQYQTFQSLPTNINEYYKEGNR
ncbi:MAG: hypothetical protein DRN27_00145 [Thermoplasmata archaeon]|nr:MAG: hypothetical protein DRN27_00145 [Thermoplasmata archaeon]